MSQRRHKARTLAMQAIYQWQLTGDNLGDICNQFLEREDSKTYTSSFFRELMHGVPMNLKEVDAGLGPVLDRSVESLDPVERAIVRLGAYELMRHPEIPYRVVINEWVELDKEYGSEQGHRFVNGVLDKLAKQVRTLEIR
ncbi:MAG: transcription antitermination factor NusB [Gammaproteobacteria bacterium]|nr:transcription antitermination factor NusB [Gammaproteobacteria bacterium]MBU1654607.1 transcription antitermination factor NusB [Gammaproteobacteria bacterium]MBU1959937.1 transcription antitermination factor NusB [Gammaproteobacteria bacterium]